MRGVKSLCEIRVRHPVFGLGADSKAVTSVSYWWPVSGRWVQSPAVFSTPDQAECLVSAPSGA